MLLCFAIPPSLNAFDANPSEFLIPCKASHVTLLPSELELARIDMPTKKKLLPALETLQVHLGRSFFVLLFP